jgi:hypothetical protein
LGLIPNLLEMARPCQPSPGDWAPHNLVVSAPPGYPVHHPKAHCFSPDGFKLAHILGFSARCNLDWQQLACLCMGGE